MTRSRGTLSGREIEAEIRRFGAFADAYRDFLDRFGRERIFTEEPPEDSCGSVAAHLLEGRYLLHAFYYEIEREACERAVYELLELLGRHLPVRKKDLERIQSAFSSGKLDPREFVVTVFRNQGDRFLNVVREQGLEEDLATFFAVYLTRLFRVKACRHLCEDIDYFDFGDWGKGYCPACGHWPALAHVDPGNEKRTLWCLNCGTVWPFGRFECVYCLNQEEGRLDLIGPPGAPAPQVQVCHDCREYLKEVRSPVPTERFPFDACFLGTHPLDLFARGQGFVHESLLAFEADDTAREAQLLSHRMRLPWDH
jgi:FdhE protein